MERNVKYTLFTTLRPISDDGIFRRNQLSALESWSRLNCEVLILGNDQGTDWFAKQFGFRHIVRGVEYIRGIPTIESVFRLGEKEANHDIVGFVCSDIILASAHDDAVRDLAHCEKFLAVSNRYDLNQQVFKKTDFEGNWESWLNKRGGYGRPDGADVYLFRKGSLDGVEWRPLLMGRFMWDLWLMSEMNRMKIPLVDISLRARAYHQLHTPRDDPKNRRFNERQVGQLGKARVLHATWYLTAAGELCKKDDPVVGIKRIWQLPLGHPWRNDPVWPASRPLWERDRKRLGK